jgi:hypothetical protein
MLDTFDMKQMLPLRLSLRAEAVYNNEIATSALHIYR